MNSLKENLEPTPDQKFDAEGGDENSDSKIEILEDKKELTSEQENGAEEIISLLKKSGIEIEKKHDLPENFIKSDESRLVVKGNNVYSYGGVKRIVHIDPVCRIDRILEIKERLNLPEEFIQFIIEEIIINRIERERPDSALEIKERLNLPEEFFQLAVEEGLINVLRNGCSVNNFIEELDLPEGFLQSLKIKSAAKDGIIKILKSIGIDALFRIKEKNNLSENFIQSPKIYYTTRKKIIYSSEYIVKKPEVIICGDIESKIKKIFEIKEKINLSEEIFQSAEAQSATKEAIINCLGSCDIDAAFSIKKNFCLSEELLQSTEVISAAKKGMIYWLKDNNVDFAIKIKEEFNINLFPSDIFESTPEIKELVSKIEKISPEFAAQANKTADILISLLPFKNNHEGLINEITENPFLTDAISENPRFGSRLLIKYPEFDETSKENINFLFDAKKEIMAANPEMEPESLEFRQAMQEKLQGYANNQKIINKMEASGFNTEQWLNYDQTEYFTLESGGEQVAFSDVLSSPVERIKETIDSYAHCIKETLKQFRVEFSAKKISLGEDLEIKNKITILKEQIAKAEASGSEEDSKKAQGMKRGLEALEKKFGQEKTVVVWDKLIGEINSFQVLKDSLLAAQEKLVAAEKKLEEVTTGKTPSGKMIQDVKQQLNSAKEDLRTKFSLLERRIENFKTELPKTAGLVLGQERAEAIVQEIEMKVAEQFNHYETDRGTVANLFSEKSASEKDKMTGQPLSIFVWARNPDIDLYQGNYSPCCISIESEICGSKSTIADYNSDLGVQIVNILDEVKNEPITAAWCWPAIKAGKKVLMVDNIESKTKYSTNFPEQLTKELFSYLENYAQAIGADKVCLGKTYNDLPVASEAAKMSNDGNTYKKLGGYNRPDGYFLEAENNSVKIIWEKEVKEKKTKENKVEQVAKIEFANVNFSNLQKEKFALIKKLEKEIYPEELISGQVMIDDIEQNNGLEYSFVANGENPNNKKEEAVGYLIAVEDETDEGDKSVYLEDFAVKAEARGQGLGFSLLTNLIDKLKTKAEIENKPVLLDMHLREDSQHLISGKTQELEDLGARIIEEALVPDYYGDNIDALYLIFEIGRRGNEEDGYENDGDDEDDN